MEEDDICEVDDGKVDGMWLIVVVVDGRISC